MIRVNKSFIYVYFFCLLFIVSCNYGNPRNFDTPTQGTEKIGIDENYFLIFESQIYTFMAQYQDAVLYPSYQTENDLFKNLLDDSCDLIVASRDLSPEEKHFFSLQNRFPKTVQIGEEAIALVVNRQNADSVFTMSELEQIFSGRISNWKSIKPQSNLNSLALVIDNKDGSNARFLRDNYIKSANFPNTITSATSNTEVIDYVEKNPGAIGIMSGTWFADEQDSVCQNYLSRVQLVAIKKDESSEAYRPYQGYIFPHPTVQVIKSENFLLSHYPGVGATHEYPLTRKIYMINAEGSNGLVTGFVAFVSGEKGQLIILKSGIVPAIVPTRSVKIESENKL